MLVKWKSTQRYISHNTSKPNTMYDVLHVPYKGEPVLSEICRYENVISQFGQTRCWLKNRRGKVRATGTKMGKLHYLDTVNYDMTLLLPVISGTSAWVMPM